jgi:hypothetical protein
LSPRRKGRLIAVTTGATLASSTVPAGVPSEDQSPPPAVKNTRPPSAVKEG